MNYIETIVDLKNLLLTDDVDVEGTSLIVEDFQNWYNMLDESDKTRQRNLIYQRCGGYGHIIIDELIHSEKIDIVAVIPEIKEHQEKLLIKDKQRQVAYLKSIDSWPVSVQHEKYGTGTLTKNETFCVSTDSVEHYYNNEENIVENGWRV